MDEKIKTLLNLPLRVILFLKTFCFTNAVTAGNAYDGILGPGFSAAGCIFRLTCSHPELTEDHVLTSANVKFFRTVTRNAVNKSV